MNKTTIANCYKKAGFKVSDDTDAVDIEADIDNNPLENLPLARLMGSNFTMSDYVSVDDVPTCEELTDNAIVDDIAASMDATADDNEDDDWANNLEIPPVESPTADMALKACDTLRHVDKCVMQIDLSKTCAKQSMITDFFRM